MPDDGLLQVAKQFFQKKISRNDLIIQIASLPPLSDNDLQLLKQEADHAATYSPRLAWSILFIANQSAKLQKSIRLQAFSAFYLAESANLWGQAKLVHQASRQARQGFTELQLPTWKAACNWLDNDLLVTSRNQIEAKENLYLALKILENAPLQPYVERCRISYAYSQFVLGEYDAAMETIKLGQTKIIPQEDSLTLAQSWLIEAAICRMVHQFKRGTEILDKAYEFFQQIGHQPLLGRVFQLYGLNSLFGSSDYAKTAYYFLNASQLFSKCEMDLWVGYTQNYLGLTYLQDGRLSLAQSSLQAANRIFRKQAATEQLANNFTAQGLCELSRGNPQTSVTLFTRALRLCEELDQKPMVATNKANLGRAYIFTGRYQEALFWLEKAVNELEELGNPLATADCEANMVSAWTELRDYQKALYHLSKAEQIYELTQQNTSLTALNTQKAKIYLLTNSIDNAIAALENSLARCQKFNLRPQAALARLILAQVYYSNNKRDESISYIDSACKEFHSMGLIMEETECHLLQANMATNEENYQKAQKLLGDILQLAGNVFPEIEWSAHAGLATVYEKKQQYELALHEYRLAILSLGNIRNKLWQANLAGRYFSKPQPMFSKAVALASQMNSTSDLWNFIEGGKAASMVTFFQNPSHPLRTARSKEMEDLRAEIYWLQNQLRTDPTSQNTLQITIANRQYKQRLIELSNRYDELKSKQERRDLSTQLIVNDVSHEMLQARRQISQQFGQKWTYLDYFITNDRLYVAAVLPSETKSFNFPISPRIKLAIEACKASQKDGIPPQENDLETLGELLIPLEIWQSLTSETLLFLSPHQDLHGLPFNALKTHRSDQYLVERSVPVVIPSFQNAIINWENKRSSEPIETKKGLIVGVTQFMGRYRDLPYVEEEVNAILPVPTPQDHVLLDENATWPALSELANNENKKGLRDFSFLHLASHFLTDTVSGRLNGIALWNENLYLDQLLELSPLPGLVTLSGCSSAFSRTFPGDEHFGLPTTCLMGGADTVIASYWPISDSSSAAFMKNFYSVYLEGVSPAFALAKTQRDLVAIRNPLPTWASYCCIGRP